MKKTISKAKSKPVVEKSAVYVLDGTPFTYILRYKNVKNFNLRVQNEQSFTVSVPHGTSQAPIQRFLDDHADFLRSALEKQNKRHRAWHVSLQEQPLEDGAQLVLLDRRIFLRFVSKNADFKKPCLTVEANEDGSECWWISPGNCASEQERRKQIGKLVISEEMCRLKQAVDACLPELAGKILCAAADLGISGEIMKCYPHMRFVKQPLDIRFRDMSSRWGSCIPQKGSLCINSRLIFAPASCLRYVVCHELCHFIYADHSPRFYRLLERAMPDAMENRKILQGKTLEK